MKEHKIHVLKVFRGTERPVVLTAYSFIPIATKLMFINFPFSLAPSTIGILLRPRSALNFPHRVMSHSNCLTEPRHPSGKGPRPLLGTELKK